MELQGKVAIVTGSTKGIGLATVEALIAKGCRVVVSSRHREDIDRVVADLGENSIGIPCDVGVQEQFENLIEETVEKLGGLDILINNAGVGIFKPVEEMDPDDWNRTIRTNLDSLFYGCHAALPKMKARGGGFIINIGSLAGKNAFPEGAAYNASKFALVGFSEALMQEVRHDNIRVAYVMPGSVDTWFGGKAPRGESSWKLAASDVADVVVDTLQRDPRCLTSRIEMRPSKPPKK